ncbi:hypothetical protein [Ignicoccus hospitalis]|nr:hypothetical protein [Ignicoccus hospitalis]HIH89700.1 hypothetical protein [Desulfurococcaceae archaeon]
MSVVESAEAELKEAAAQFYERKQLLAFAASYALASALGAALKQPAVAGAGLALVGASAVLFKKIISSKIEAVREAWDLLLDIKGLDTKLIQNPEERKELEELIQTKYSKFKRVVAYVKDVAEELKGKASLAFALYGAGSGLASSSLAFSLPWPVSLATYAIMTLLFVTPLPSIVYELREVVT